jgi:predicted N-formylglutamate amidohydrolase
VTADASDLLQPDEAAPAQVIAGNPSSPFLITCDHAGQVLPRSLGTLGLTRADLDTHIAWDIGAAGVARRLGVALEAFVILQTYSRLAIDCNRPLGVESSIAKKSELIVIPGNQSVSAEEAELRARSIFAPYHWRIEQELGRREAARLPTTLVAIHSFTPRFLGVARPWHAGVLYNRDPRLAHIMLELLRREPGLVVGDNEPYSVSDLSDYGVVMYGERRGLPHVELEIRQDLIADEVGQAEWAERLARLLREAAAALAESR